MYPWVISKDFAFSASHALEGLPAEHQCARLHGHNYIVRVTLGAQRLNDVGFVVDYGELKPVQQFIDDTLDHRHLNEVLNFNPTAEHMASWLSHRVREALPRDAVESRGLEVVSIAVSETPKTWATFSLRAS